MNRIGSAPESINRILSGGPTPEGGAAGQEASSHGAMFHQGAVQNGGGGGAGGGGGGDGTGPQFPPVKLELQMTLEDPVEHGLASSAPVSQLQPGKGEAGCIARHLDSEEVDVNCIV